MPGGEAEDWKVVGLLPCCLVRLHADASLLGQSTWHHGMPCVHSAPCAFCCSVLLVAECLPLRVLTDQQMDYNASTAAGGVVSNFPANLWHLSCTVVKRHLRHLMGGVFVCAALSSPLFFRIALLLWAVVAPSRPRRQSGALTRTPPCAVVLCSFASCMVCNLGVELCVHALAQQHCVPCGCLAIGHGCAPVSALALH